MHYNQFCPVSKALEVLGEKWTLLIVRELLCGSTRFNELQRGLSQISPTLLSKRLAAMAEQGLIVRRHIPGQKGYEYFPTQACQELFPIVEQAGIWGMRWARHQMRDQDYDLEQLMLYLERAVQTEQLIGRETVIRFNFKELEGEYGNWWFVVTGDEVDVCLHDPGKEVDVYFTATVKTMCQLLMGEISYRNAVRDGALLLVGQEHLTRHVESWLKPSIFAGIEPANPEQFGERE